MKPFTTATPKSNATRNLAGRNGLRILLPALLSAQLLASCATAPGKVAPPIDTKPVPAATSTTVFDAAYESFSQGRFDEALKLYDDVLANPASSNDQRRQAYLGRALVFLSPNKQWRNLKSARVEVQLAVDLQNAEGAKTSAETRFLTSALMGLVSAESDNAEASAKISQLQKDKAAFSDERAALLAEQKRLNASLEKLKKLTLGK